VPAKRLSDMVLLGR